MGKCFYCDGWKVVAGQGCRNSPIGKHVVDDGPTRCIYCDINSASSSASCNLSSTGYHVLGSESTSPDSTFDATNSVFIWISILATFAMLAVPLLYLFNWSIDTFISKSALVIAFVISLFIGYKFAYYILKAVFIILGLIIIGLTLYYILF